ncbi:hypothetical protein ASPZODRAFT_11507 [Penicilliopsis zonata CBS 506.65]|uniref:Hydrophobin n=1 Tax=Penicilliopsis zonata CBS 506.65 TaxID=1073090 RepID=A0A1L9SU94_9EURO|nr:hypothetical protein ASPZODRAFT_11507 [Penicilliopsis zonata CBS 506.65]OJJ50643.1 hypothetical protein ASPZODRAFT_11507 [Penicilliopsis zonata CBS 506.65]
MQIIALLPLIAVAAAGSVPYAKQPSSPSPTSISIAQAKTECSGGEGACCNSYDEMSANGILGNLLGKGLLPNLLGQGDSPCAKFSLIDNLNILGITEEDGGEQYCTGSTACCTGDECKEL